MRTSQQITGATGASDWLRIDNLQRAFAVGFDCTVGGATAPSMTYKVEHAFSTNNPDTVVYITRSSTTATLKFNAATTPDGATWVNHGLSVGDSLQVYGAGAPLDGTYPVATVVDNRTVTYTVANSGNAVNDAGASVIRLYVGTHTSITASTGTTAGNYAYPINFIRTNITTYSAGSLTFEVNQGF